MNTQQIALRKRVVAVAAGVIAALGISATGIVFAQTAPPTCSMSVSPSSISPGAAGTLSWTATNAQSGSIDQGIGALGTATSGSMVITPLSTMTYIGTFAGSGGTTTCAATATVAAPVTTQPQPATVSATVAPPVVPAPYPPSGSTPMPMVMQIDDSGNATVRGTVQSVGNGTLTINAWGGLWIVRTSDETIVYPAGASSGDVSMFQVGDFVGVDGTVAQDQVYTVDASVVRDWTTDPSNATSVGTSVSTTATPAPTTVTAPAAGTASATTAGTTLYTGTASDITTDSFTLTDASGNTYSVLTDGNTTFLDENSDPIDITQISDADGIRLDGTLDANGNLDASVVRDTSLPVSSSGSTDTSGASSAPMIPASSLY